MSMVFMNKAVLSAYSFECPNAVVFAQCLTAVVFVAFFEAAGYVRGRG